MTVLFIISFTLFILYVLLLLYYRNAWLSIPHEDRATGATPTTKLTVVIPARNEAENIGNCLASITTQSYPAHLFEVIVVDDHSTDNTAEIVRSFPGVRLLSLSDYVTDPLNAYKKKAIEVAIANSSGELIITTDADCIVPKNWLLTIACFYEAHQPAFIAAPVSIDTRHSFISIFQSLDFMTLQGITGAAVHKKTLSMCNGANLAYTKAAFEKVGGFSGIDNIASGDDMLLMHKIYKAFPGKVMYLKSKTAIVRTAPVNSLGAFFNQRIRWASKADKYDDKRIFFVLLIVYLFNLLLLVLPVMDLCGEYKYSISNIQYSMLQVWGVLLIGKTIVEMLFLFPVARFFSKTSLLVWFPLMQPFHILYTVIAGFLGKFGSYKWKGRTVK